MHFRSRGRVNGLFLNTGESTLFQFDDGGVPIRIELRGPTPAERADPKTGSDAYYSFDVQIEPPNEIRQMFESLAQGKMPTGSTDATNGLPTTDGGARYFPDVGPDGSIRPDTSPPEELLPEAYHKWVDEEIGRRSTRYLTRTVGVVRWRYAQEGSHHSLTPGDSTYSLDGSAWHPMPSGMRIEATSRSAVRISEEVRDWVTEIVKNGGAEPLGHELFREASTNRYHNPRSAVILAVAAAEAAVKQCITNLVPDATWLVETGPSPGLVEMIKNYLPQLPVKGKVNDQVPIFPKAVRSVLDDAVRQRNKLVHVGIGQPSAEDARRILTAVWDVLCLCDFYVGHPWALEYLSSETRASMRL